MFNRFIIISFVSLLLVKHGEPAFASIKNVIKNKFEPTKSNFFSSSEVEHLDMIRGDEFSCFVEEKGDANECKYGQQNFKDTCTGCTVEDDGTVVFKNPGNTVTVVGNDLTTAIDGTSLDSTETGVTALYIVNTENIVSIGSDIFEKFPNLEELTVYGTAITSIPNITKPLSQLLYLAILNNKALTRINDYDFTQMPNLEHLNLACNNVSYISGKAFVGLPSLTKLTLGFNSLLHFPGALSEIKATVKYIGLERNYIATLPAVPLKGMDSLVHLNLTLNHITKLEAGWTSGCHNLIFLDLGESRVEALESFAISGLSNLIYLDISSNSLMTHLEGSALKDLPALRILDLYGNEQLANIDYRAFDNLPKLEYMDLSRNSIANFPHSSFIYGKFAELRKLWIHANSMTSLGTFSSKSFNSVTGILESHFEDVYSLSKSFNQMKNLEYLDLSDNSITTIPDGVLDCFKAADKNSTLDLSSNKIVFIGDDAFSEMRLKDLDLRDNFLSEVPKAMFNVKYLDNLYLSYNLLTYLENGTLSNLNMTQEVYLNNNQILKIEDDALPRSLSYISIANNYFDFLDKNQFNNMPNLEAVDFSNNRISYLPEDVFANNTNLHSVVLNNNNINWVNKGVFTTCRDSISYINMESNGLAYVEHQVLAGKNIATVQMANNKLHDWPQDGSFSNQSGEFYVDFSDNQFEVIKSGMFSHHENFRKADFKNNLISDVEANAFSNLDIDYKQSYKDIFGILLTSNPISNLEPYSFTNITSEKSGGGKENHARIDLQMIKTLYTLRSNTFHNVKLDYIFLNEGKVETIETHAFYKIYLHWTLQFNDGPLKYVSKKAINADYIQFIQLNGNSIRKLPLGAFEEIAECVNFNIQDNDINFIDTDSLPNCSEKFNFQSNKITYIIADAFRKATSIKRLELENNDIIKIEAGAFDTFLSKLNNLYVTGNPLPELPDDLLATATLTNLELKSNEMLRTIGTQEDVSFSNSNSPAIGTSQKAFIDASLYKNVKNGGSNNVNIFGVSECTCNLLQAVKNVDDKNRGITVKGPSKCSYNDARDGNSAELSVNINSPGNGEGKIQCEPYVTRTVRTSTTFKDEVAIAESITMYWKLPAVPIWGSATVYCCSDNAGNDCIDTVTLVMVCQSQAIDENSVDIIETPEFTVSLSTQNSCDQEFSYFEEIDFSTSDFIFCSAKIKIELADDAYYSAMGPWRVGYREAVRATPSLCDTVSKAMSLDATYYDLTNDFVDFQNMGKDTIYESPKVYNSPNIGPYLYMTDHLSEDDSLTQWFTPNSNIQNILQQDFCLKECNEFGDDAYCMFAREWWPVDSLVDFLTDTTSNFARHNMYFTGRLRVPIKFGGDEIITIGGPDDIWVFMNGSLVLEVLAAEEDTESLLCGEITFGSDGRTLITKLGYLDMSQIVSEDYNARCMDMNVTDNWADPSIFVLNDNMYVDIFTTQRRSGTSQIFMRLSNFEKIEWSNFVVFAMSEVKVRDGKIDQLDFDTVLGTQPYEVTTIEANSHFEMHDGHFAWVEDPAQQEANVRPGSGVPEHYNCSVEEEAVPDVAPSASSRVETTTALLTLKNQIDYETIEPKYFLLHLNTTYQYAGERSIYTLITIRIDVVDANDNCPVFEDSLYSLIDRTNLCLDLRGNQLNVSDNDNGNNSVIEFFIGAYEVTNLNASQYEVYKSVDDYFTYEETIVAFEVEVYSVDAGSPVRCGTWNKYRLQISASCIQDMELVVGGETGLFNVKAPGWMVSSGALSFCDTCTLGYRCPGLGSRIQCSTCRQSFTNSVLDAWMFDVVPRQEEGCVARSQWEIAFGSQDECYDCKPGWQCSGGVGTPVEQLERNQSLTEGTHFINLCTDEDVDCEQELQLCEAGYLCRAGVTGPCPAGQFSNAGSSGCSFCPPGKYAPQPGSANCTCCDGGQESTHAKESCDYCPENEVSGGCSMCRRCMDETECPCTSDTRPCSDGVQCVNLPDNTYTCLSCPEGFTDQDGSCVDIDECELYSPCYSQLHVTCTNTVPGFQCGSCPAGYEGDSPEGIGEPEHNQTCADINECETNNGGCDANSECINMPGYHYCGYCFGQWVGNGTAECESGDYCSDRDKHRCDSNAICTTTGPAGYQCECNTLYAGNGTACGIDTDGDGYPDAAQNCLGDTCKADNCASYPNSDQADIDGDSLGDECDTDIDGDLIINSNDLCPYNSNISTAEAEQNDADDDGWLDDCDNCKDSRNYDQYDKDFNGIGDECEDLQNSDAFTDVLTCTTASRTGTDSDGDGVDDGCDNCPYVANASQRDTDVDSIGDRCDADIDGDTLPNTEDYCPYIPSTDQADQDRDFKGDPCDDSKSWPDTMVNDADADGDGVPDVYDICPFDDKISAFSFATSQLIDFATLSTPSSVRWRVRSEGYDVVLEAAVYEAASESQRLSNPVALLGETRFEGLQFDGTFYISNEDVYPTLHNGAIGIIFGYQNLYQRSSDTRYITKFYLATWRNNYYTYNNCGTGRNDCNFGATTGLQIKSVTIDSSTSRASKRREALWWSASETNSGAGVTTELIYQDPLHRTWDMNKAYRWRLLHYPSTGRIKMTIHTITDSAVDLVVDTGDLFDKTVRGGRIGLFSHAQWNVTFANTAARCLDPENGAASFAGGSFLSLGALEGLGITRSFEISVWFKMSSTPTTTTPIFCKNKQTNTQTLCLSITPGLVLQGEYAGRTLITEETVALDTWTHAILKYDMQFKVVTLFSNAGGTVYNSVQTQGVDVGPANEVLYLGWDGEQYLTGATLDEVRVLNRLLNDTSYMYTVLLKSSLVRENKMRLVGAHINFDRGSFVDVLGNIQMGELNTNSAVIPALVTSSVLGEMYRLDSKGDLEEEMATTNLGRGRRPRNRGRRATRGSVESGHDEL